MLILTFKNSPNVQHGVTFSTINDNVIQINGKNIPKNTSGFYLSRIDKKDKWDYTNYTTIYRVIDENIIQFSNDGSKWIEPINLKKFEVRWNDVNDFEGLRPNSVAINVKVGNELRELIFTKDNNWTQYTYVKETEHTSIVEIEAVPDYTSSKVNNIIVYSHIVDKKGNYENRITTLENDMLYSQLAIDELLTDIIPMQQDEVAVLAESIDTILTEIIPEIIESLIPPNDEEELLDVEEENFNEEALFSKKKGK